MTTFHVEILKPSHYDPDGYLIEWWKAWIPSNSIERIVRENAAQGIAKFVITDDNFARNRNWEAIFDRLIKVVDAEGEALEMFVLNESARPAVGKARRQVGARQRQAAETTG